MIHSRAVIVDRQVSWFSPLKKGFESDGLSDCWGISRSLRIQVVELSLTLFEAMRLSLEFQNVAMVREAIEKRSQKAFVLKNLRPIGKREVGCDQDGGAQVHLADEGE